MLTRPEASTGKYVTLNIIKIGHSFFLKIFNGNLNLQILYAIYYYVFSPFVKHCWESCQVKMMVKIHFISEV